MGIQARPAEIGMFLGCLSLESNVSIESRVGGRKTSMQGRAGQGWAGAGQHRAGQGRGSTGQHGAGQGSEGQGRGGQSRAGQGWAGLTRVGQGRAGQGRQICTLYPCSCKLRQGRAEGSGQGTSITSRYSLGNKSGLDDSACPTLTKEGPSFVSSSRSWTARLCMFFSKLPVA